MISANTLLTFSAAAMLLSLSPGPSNLYIMARSINQGVNAGAAAAGGLAVGSFIYVLAAAFGLSALFHYAPLAFTVIKLGGALYLIYLGIQYWRAHPALPANNNGLTAKPLGQIFRQSIIVELTNPKTALFFIAFLPQFISPQEGNTTLQFLLLGSLYAVIAFSCDMLVANLAGKLGKWLQRHANYLSWQDKIAGSILCILGGVIAIQELSSH